MLAGNYLLAQAPSHSSHLGSSTGLSWSSKEGVNPAASLHILSISPSVIVKLRGISAFFVRVIYTHSH